MGKYWTQIILFYLKLCINNICDMEYSFNQILQEIANGKRQVTIKFPDVDTPIKAIITDIRSIQIGSHSK